jgi:cellulose synthase/poly-beta-1,6-N-acetylglucosamine synthase-like glycosyltransferase
MTLILIIYILAAACLFIYGANCYLMIALFLRRQKTERAKAKALFKDGEKLFETPEALPHVTTQIPLYNEANVVERVIRTVAAMAYPADKHEIQILDDSNDETCAIVDALAKELKAVGHDISVVRRSDRTGFKAGALRYGMESCKGEYIAIFDADFVPPADFLHKLVPALKSDDTISFVQARWGHLNPDSSLLTRAQRIGIDGHFMIEQCARSYNGLFLNFNGTAGLWRKEAIIDGGNWQDDTLTEDMDLSYRCQLAGWTAAYYPDVIVPAELPESYAAFKSQQFRWAKGSIQTALKIMPRVMRSKASLFAKVQAFLHMTHYCIHPLMATMALLALPILLKTHITLSIWQLIPFIAAILISLTGPSALYCVSQFSQGHAKGWNLLHLPGLVCIGVGIALSNTRAIFEAFIGINSPFVRTPKSGNNQKKYSFKANWFPMIEILMGVYCAFSFAYYLHAGKYIIGQFLLIYTLGFLIVGFRSLLEQFNLKSWFTGLLRSNRSNLPSSQRAAQNSAN